MRLHSKTIGVLILVFAALLSASAGFYYFYVLKDVLNIEREIALTNGSRVREAFNAELEKARGTIVDWGCFDDTYAAMKELTPHFIESWTEFESYKVSDVSETFFFDTNRVHVLGYLIDSQKKSVSTLRLNDPQSAEIAQVSAAFEFAEGRSSQAHFARYRGRPAIIASTRILDSSHTAPSRGTLVLVKYVTKEMIEVISQQTQVSLTMAAHPFGNSDVITVAATSDDLIETAVPVGPAGGQPVFTLEFSTDRPIYAQAITTLRLFLGFWTIASAAVLTLAGLLINRFVLSRLRLISQSLRDINNSWNFDACLQVEGSDEIAQITQDINLMIEKLRQRHYVEVLRARDKAEAANRAKTNFMSNVSHELRTPLHSILGIVGIMWRAASDDNQRMQLGLVRDSAVGLLGVVNDVLDFSKSEAGQLSVKPGSCNVRNAVRKALRLVAPRLFERSEAEPIECVAEIATSVPEFVRSDEARITQILGNLLANAIKFTRFGSVRVLVQWVDSGDGSGMLECSVRDTGIGIPAEKLPSLFKPFSQVEESGSRSFQGTGLGLAIVKQLVTALGGEVQVISDFGKGSCFCFRIPMRKVEACRPPGARLSDRTVWVIDELPVESGSICRALADYGAQVKSIGGNALRALEQDGMLKQARAGLVISATVLANELSWAMLTKFVDRYGASDVVVIVSTHQLSYRERLRALGVVRIVFAPVVAQDVARAMLGEFAEDFSVYDDFVDVLPNSGAALEVLIADDIVSNQIVLKCILQDLGHRVTVVNNGQELLESVEGSLGDRNGHGTKRFDLVLTDLQMPVLDGLSALKKIRELESELGIAEAEKVPVFLVTSQSMQDQFESMLAAGASAIISKPLDVKALEEKIRALGEKESGTVSLS